MRRVFLSLAAAVAVVVSLSAAPASARQVVQFQTAEMPGTIIVRTSERRLYYVLGNGQAVRYPIAVGMPGRTWAGRTVIARKAVNPVWSPPAAVRADKPSLPNLIPPGPRNPLGPRAMLLAGGEYAIHGTNKPSSIGTQASYGCIRMFNEHVVELYEKVHEGTPVVVQ